MSMSIAENPSRSSHCADCQVRSLSVCAALHDDELGTLERIARHVLFESKETLFHQGAPSDAVYNVTEGTIRLSRVLRDGRRQVLGFAMAGDFLGLADRMDYDFSADAVTAASACRFSRASHAHLAWEKAHFLRRLHETATHELTLAHDQIMLLGRCTAQERVAAFLLQLRRRWAVLHDGKASVTVPLPMGRQDIADYLGLTIETVSRTLCQLARDKTLVIVPDGIRISDVQRLERLAGT